MQSEPRGARTPVWALSVSLAATPEITFCFLFLRLLRCFSSPGSLRIPIKAYAFVQHTVTEVSSAGFPHSEIHGSPVICTSPWLFAAYHVFRRLLVPRHPPCALSCLTCGSTLEAASTVFLSGACSHVIRGKIRRRAIYEVKGMKQTLGL